MICPSRTAASFQARSLSALRARAILSDTSGAGNGRWGRSVGKVIFVAWPASTIIHRSSSGPFSGV